MLYSAIVLMAIDQVTALDQIGYVIFALRIVKIPRLEDYSNNKCYYYCCF